MMYKLRIIIFLLSGLAFFAGCEKDYYSAESVVDITTPVSFASQIQPILTEDCATSSSCHSSGGASPDLTSGISYDLLQAFVDTSNAEASELYLRILSSEDGYRMPKNAADRLNNSEISLILAWIKQGAQNN